MIKESRASRARIVASIMLVLCLCASVRDVLTPAYALDTYRAQASHTDIRFDAYLVLRANISDEGHATDIAWASADMAQVVLGYLDATSYGAWLQERHPDNGQHDLAQNAAEYLCLIFGDGDAAGSNGTTAPTPTGLAQAIANSGITPNTTVTKSEALTGEQGYWLVVSDPTTLQEAGDVGTEPLWIALAGSTEEIVEKASMPTLALDIQEDSTGSWGKAADANRGQEHSYRLTGSLPENFEAFSRYHYCFDVTLPEGIELSIPAGKTLTDVLTIAVDGQQLDHLPHDAHATLDNRSLVIDLGDLLSDDWDSCKLAHGSTISVVYDGYLSAAAHVGADGNQTKAQLVYTCDPVSLLDGHTETVNVTAYTYELALIKVQSKTSKSLAGAAFHLLAKDDDASHANRYIQADGSLGEEAHIFMSDETGSIHVSGLDEGTYTLHEVEAPEGHQKLSGDVPLNLTSKIDEVDGTLDSITLSVTHDKCKVLDVKPEQGLATLQIANDPTPKTPTSPTVEKLPQTGVGPIATTLITVGLIIFGLSAIRNAK